MLMVTATLISDTLISKSIGIIYTPRQMSVKFDEPMSTYHSDKVRSIYQHVDSLCDLDLRQINLKIDRIINTPIKMSVPKLTNLGINMLTVTVTLTYCPQNQ